MFWKRWRIWRKASECGNPLDSRRLAYHELPIDYEGSPLHHSRTVGFGFSLTQTHASHDQACASVDGLERLSDVMPIDVRLPHWIIPMTYNAIVLHRPRFSACPMVGAPAPRIPRFTFGILSRSSPTPPEQQALTLRSSLHSLIDVDGPQHRMEDLCK